MESLADAGLAAMHRFRLLQRFEISEPARDESRNWPKSLFLAQFDRFELWAVNLGVFVMGHGSLDYRIRDSEHMREAILKMVKSLTRSLDEVLDYLNGDIEQEDEESDIDSEMESDMDLLLDSVKDPIDRLYQLAVWIRNPAVRLPSSKARDFQQIDQETKLDLFKSFESFDYDYIRSLFLQYEKDRALQEKPTAKPQEDVGDIDDQDRVWEPIKTTLELNKLSILNGSESYLVRRIARANGRRRQQFAYWRKHKDKLRAHSSVVVDAPTHEPPTAGQHIEGGEKSSPTKAPLTITTATQLRLTDGIGKESFDNVNVLDFAVSEYAPSAWEPSKDTVSFPLPPKVSTEDQFFECPYCYTICPAPLLAKRAWRAHLIRDLRPYICTFEHCSTPEQLYDSRDDWIQHETSAHHTILRCPKHEEETFTTTAAYEAHIRKHHHNQTLPLSLAKSITDMHRGCPICSRVLQTTQQLQSHIALHLERFAMFTLPRSLDEAKGSDFGSQSSRVHLASDRSSNGHSDLDSEVDGRAEDVNVSIDSIIRMISCIQSIHQDLWELRTSRLNQSEQDATDFFRELVGVQMRVKRYAKTMSNWPWSTATEDVIDSFSEICFMAGMVKEAIAILERLPFPRPGYLDFRYSRLKNRLEDAYEIIEMLNEVDELLKDGTDIHTEPGQGRALKLFARTQPGMLHAETLWGPHIWRKESRKALRPQMNNIKAVEKSMEKMKEVLQQEEAKRRFKHAVREAVKAEKKAEEDKRRREHKATEMTEGPFVPGTGHIFGEKGHIASGAANTSSEWAVSSSKSEVTMTRRDGLIHKEGIRWNHNGDEGSPAVQKFNSGFPSPRFVSRVQGNAIEEEAKLSQQVREDPEMEEERKQVEREIRIFRLIWHPLLVAAQTERLQEEKESNYKDTEVDSAAHVLEMELMAFQKDVEVLEYQFLAEAQKSERREKARVLVTKMQSFNWKAIEERLEKMQAEKRQRRIEQAQRELLDSLQRFRTPLTQEREQSLGLLLDEEDASQPGKGKQKQK